jgi:hypothetical protein
MGGITASLDLHRNCLHNYKIPLLFSRVDSVLKTDALMSSGIADFAKKEDG